MLGSFATYVSLDSFVGSLTLPLKRAYLVGGLKDLNDDKGR